MKKFLKVFLIILLVLTAIGGTAYFFFRDLEERNNNTGSISAMLESETKLTMDKELLKSFANANFDGTDNRLNLVIQTSENLDEIVNVLATYYVRDNTSINDEKICNQLQSVKSARQSLNYMMEEYNLKASYNLNSELKCFDMHKGANDLYKQSCDYLVKYATFAKSLNNSLTKIEKTADFKFTMFEIYANIVIDQFGSFEESSGVVSIKNDKNIKFINTKFEIDDSFIKTYVDKFSITINKFNNLYASCDKKLFAKQLSENVEKATSEFEETNEEIAAYYFKLIYGI